MVRGMNAKGLPTDGTAAPNVYGLWPEYMDKHMASAYVGGALKPKTLMNYRHLGRLGKYTLGNRKAVVFKRTELDALVVCECPPIHRVSAGVSD
jgi:hypothetical protein